VLDKAGELIVPSEQSLDADSKQVVQNIITPAFQQFAVSRQSHFLIENEKVKHIVYIGNFPIDLGQNWLIVVSVPFDDFFGATVKTQRQTILISLGILVLFGIFVFYSSKHISRPIVQLAQEVDRIRHFDFSTPVVIDSHIEEIVALDSSISAMRAAISSFGRYVPKDIVKTLIEQGQEISIGGEKRQITIMFSDIRDFTASAEILPVEVLMSDLSKYFDVLSKIILDSEGTIDKYIGDSVMAIWGAPQVVTDQMKKACLATLRGRKAVEALTIDGEKWITRFGLHCGEAIVGNIGTAERMNYTAIGDIVNTASRLEGINKTYGTTIVISQSVKDSLDGNFITRPLDIVAVKGKKQKLTIYELIGMQREPAIAATPEQVELCQTFSDAYTAFYAGKLDEAKKLFLSLQQRFPSDEPTKIYLDRIK
jgi:adenylate cyclase